MSEKKLKRNFEILSDMADANDNIRMSTTVVSADKKGENGFITMGVEGSIPVEVMQDGDKYIFALFVVDKKRYFELAAQESEFEKMKAKAEKWDKLDERIGAYYSEGDEEQDEPDGDLGTIGEIAAGAFGYL